MPITSIRPAHRPLPNNITIPRGNIVTKIFNKVNKYRENHGLSKLIWDDKIANQAKKHSGDMARIKRISHDGFNQRWNNIRNQINGARGIAENVAMNFRHNDPASCAVKGWINSDGHRKNMEGDYNRTGIAVQKAPDGAFYLTQIFVKV